MNRLKLTALFGLLLGVPLILGGFSAGLRGAMFGLAISAMVSGLIYWRAGDKTLRRFKAHKIKDDSYWIKEIIKELSLKAKIPPPDLYILPLKGPNAFAVGRSPKRSSVALSEKLIELLEERELAGVIAHEIAHIASRDTLLATVVASLAGAWGFLAGPGGMALSPLQIKGRFSSARMGVARSASWVIVILAPISAALLQLAISRSREYTADHLGARYTGEPEFLARALEKIERFPSAIDLDRMPHLAHMFIYSRFRSKFLSVLFSTHPPVAERVKRLRKQQENMSPLLKLKAR